MELNAMDWYEVELDGSRTTSFAERGLSVLGQDSAESGESEQRARYLGGIIYGGKWGWVTPQYTGNGLLIISSLSTGDCIARYAFGSDICDYQRCNISCVEELFPEQASQTLLAICLELWASQECAPINCSKAKTNIAIYSPTFNQIFRYIELNSLYVSTLRFMNYQTCRRTYLQEFDGCLAFGTKNGFVAFMDVNYDYIVATRSQNIRKQYHETHKANIKRVRWTGSVDTINMILDDCRKNDEHFAIEIHVMRNKVVHSILPLEIASCFAAGLDDGRIVLIGLKKFETFHTIISPEDAMVQRMCCIIPPDDPQPCFYICAMYDNGKNLSMVMHTASYEQSFIDEADNQIYFEKFKFTFTRLHVTLDERQAAVIGCMTASTFSFAGDNGTMLVILSWYSFEQHKNKVVFFDINQWYKDEMCDVIEGKKPNFLSGYILSGLPVGVALLLKPTSILHFASTHRHDEHFYPNSLTFDCSLLTATSCRHYAHDGMQNRFLNFLRRQKAELFLNPQPYHSEIIRLRLIPQFYELNSYSDQAKCLMYETILSVALENNCMGLLNDCAKNWVDGSFLCNMMDPTQLSFSTLTNWISKRSRLIKSRIRELCQGIFEYGGYPLDEREKKEFQHLVTQLRHLWKLQATVRESGKRHLSAAVLNILEINENEMRLSHDYYHVLFWLIEHALLPQGQQQETRPDQEQPMEMIRRYYKTRRAQLAEVSDVNIFSQPGESNKLYIDAMLEHRRFGPCLQEAWADGEGGRYPPKTLDALLAVIQASNEAIDQKYELILYFLLDLNEQLPEVPPAQLVRQFELSFGLSEHVVKSVISFWILDRGDCAKAVEELYNVRAQIKHYEEWQMKHLINVLLAQGAVKPAVRVIDIPPGIVTAQLRLRVLLANENIPEAFHHARQYSVADGESLLEQFFGFCIRASKFKVLAELCLREDEEALVSRLLRESKSKKAECAQLILLLQKSKYIEAVSFMDEIAAEREHGVNPAIGGSFNDASNMILSAYRATMAPVTKNIAGTYFRIKDKLDTDQLKNASPEPFSCQLVKENANSMLGGIFQSSALSAHWATRYNSDVAQPSTMSIQNVPFLRNPQYDVMPNPQNQRMVRIVRPVEYLPPEKRYRELDNDVPPQYSIQPKKRRRLLDEQMVNDVCSFVKEKLSAQHAKPAEQRQPESPPRAVHAMASASQLLAKAESRYSFMPPISLQMEESVLPMDVSADGDAAADEIIVTIEDTASEKNQSQSSESLSQRRMSAESSHSGSEYLSPLQSAEASFVNVEPAPSGYPTGPQPRGSLNDVRLEIFACRPMPSTKLLQATESEQASSGFGSFEQQPIAVALANTVSLKCDEFVPIVCSSKVCNTQSEFSSADIHAKMAERTTVCIEEGNESSAHMLTATATASAWPTPPMPQPLQMLDTTLGMTAYNETALDATQQQSPPEQVAAQGAAYAMETSDNSVDYDVHAEPSEQAEDVPDEEDDEEEHASRAFNRVTELDYSAEYADSPNAQRSSREPSPSYSLNSEVSDMSSDVGNLVSLPQMQSDPMYSIVVESTNSITNSRSVSQTPTSFLPSDTNVSQNSGSQDTRGNGSPRSLYRANSLETVDDLDTTKGSLDDEDDDDDCVIALDGTKVRDYVPRAPEAPASSIAELFAYKDECNEAAQAKSQSTSGGGATVNTDSLIADSSDSQPKTAALPAVPEDAASSNDSVATVAFGESKRQQEDLSQAEVAAGNSTRVADALQRRSVENLIQCAATEPNSEQTPVAAERSTPGSQRPTHRANRAVSAPPEPNAAVPRYNLRASSQTPPKDSPRPRSRLRRNGSLQLASDSPSSSPQTVSTPKARKTLLRNHLLGIIDENAALDTESMPRTRSRSRLSQTGSSDAEPARGSRKLRTASMTSDDGSTISSGSPLQRVLRSSSEPPIMQPQPQARRAASRARSGAEPAEETAAPRRQRTRRNTNDTAEPSTEQPAEPRQRSLRPRTRKQSSSNS